MTELPEATRQRVRQRAGNRCEYCLSCQDYIMGILQIDHVQLKAKGETIAPLGAESLKSDRLNPSNSEQATRASCIVILLNPGSWLLTTFLAVT